MPPGCEVHVEEIRAAGLCVEDFARVTETTVYVPIPSLAWAVLCEDDDYESEQEIKGTERGWSGAA